MHELLKRLSQNQHKLSPLERQVIDYIMEHKEEAANYKLEDLAKALFTSTATVSRSCRALGFRGFQELKYTLRQSLRHEGSRHEAPESNSSYIQSHIERFQQEMTLTLQSIEPEKMTKLVHLIRDSERVEFFGISNSLFPCLDAAKKLTFAGKLCYARADWDDLYTTAHSLSEQDLAILVSYSGETPRMLEFANILKYRKAKIAVITGHHRNSLLQFGHICIQPYITNYRAGEIDMTSRFPMSIVFDLIILQYINETK